VAYPCEFIEGSLEVKIERMSRDEKQRWKESEKRREEEKKEAQKDKVAAERRSRGAKR
jgi:hypothetical protein